MTTGGPPPVAIALVAVALATVGAVVGVREVLDTDCAVPDVRGEPQSEAVAELLGAGVDPARVTVTRLADDSPEGAVVRQTDTTCEDPILLVVSDGGPVVDVDELSAAFQQSLAAGPGDVPDVVRRIDTDAGPVYKSDTTMVGDCPAVAEAEVADPDYTRRCRTPPADALHETVSGVLTSWHADGGEVPGVDVTANDDATAWFGRSDLGGWRLYVAVTTRASREWVAAGLPRDEVRGGGYAIRRSDHDVEVVVYLVRPRRSTLEVPPPPVGSERLDELARELLDVALTL